MSPKILYFYTLLLVLFYQIKYSHADNNQTNVLFAISINNNSDVFCVINTTTGAIYFNEFGKEVSKFYPESKGQFNCNLDEKSNKCVSLWSRVPWAIYAIGQVFVDWRWEQLETIKLSSSLLYPIVTISGTNFASYFSTRSRCELIFFLCDNNRMSLSNLCYKITLQACSNSFTLIQSCKANLQNVDRYFVNIRDNFCQNPTLLKTTNYWRQLEKQYWRHILIDKNNNHLAIYEYKNATLLPIISTTINDPLNSGVRVFSAAENDSLLKFHFRSYLLTHEESSTKLGPQLLIQNNQLCISILSRMCNQCSLNLKLMDTRNSQIIYEEDLQYIAWNEKKILLKNLTSISVQLIVSTKLRSPDLTKFWIIDGIRDCTENEFRIVSYHHSGSSGLEPICRKLDDDNLLPSKLQIDCSTDISDEQCLIDKILEFNQTETTDNFNQHHDSGVVTTLVIILFSIIILIFMFLLYKNRKLILNKDQSYINPVGYKKSSFIRRYFRHETEDNSKLIPIENLQEYVDDIVSNDVIYYEIPEYETEYFERPSIYSLDGYKCCKAFTIIENSNSILELYFWQIIWRDNIQTIIWISNDTGNINDKKLFPDNLKESLIIGEVSIKLLPIHTNVDCKFRQYLVQRKSIQRKIIQILIDMSLDDPQFIQNFAIISRKLLKFTIDAKSPILFRESNNTNTDLFAILVLIDNCLRMAAHRGVINIEKYLQYCYQQFPYLINHREFYQICHSILLECWNSIGKPFDCYEINNFDCDFIRLQIRKVLQICNKSSSNNNNSDNNQIVIDNYLNQIKLVIMKQPDYNELDEFWRRIILKQIPIIISLNSTNDSRMLMKQQVMTPLGAVTLRHHNTEILNGFQRISLEICLTGTSSLSRIEIIENNGWLVDEILPKDIKQFLQFCQESFKSFRRTNSLLLTCQNLHVGTGVYLALFKILQRIQTDFVCDIYSVVDEMAEICPNLFQNEMEIQFLYQCVQVYLKEFDNYANFN